jgi:predicted Zn-dependent peptidase
VLAAPPSAEELRRAQNQFETSFVTRLEAVPARASLLNQYEESVGDPGYAEKDLARYRKATTSSVHAVARRVLDPNARVILRVVPREPVAAKPAAAKKGGR